ncbi:MAG: SusF/SusE family outer membrane protein [Bacteroidales bacterium]|nr:SusF/SusE family outer membrane protein [Bacteroidales bacterium]
MKKFLYTSLVALAGFFAVSCQQEHIEVVYDPAAVTVQTLGEFADVVLDKDGEKIVTTFAPADFKLAVATAYQLNASASSDMANKVKVSASIDIDEKGLGTISIKQTDLNALVYALGGVADEPMTLYFQLSASVATDKKAAIGATTKESNIVSAVFTPYPTVVKDVTLYDHVWVIGSSASVGSWSFEKVYQYLYDYEKKGETFTGLIDFGEAGPSGGFKLTGAGNWDDASLNWGSEAQAEEEEAETITLLADGGSKDIKCYSHRYYFFSLDRASLVLTKKYSFDNVGIVGAFNGWAADDANMKMTYNDQFHRFYIDQTFAEDTELKFTSDDKWDLNWGGEDGKTAGNGTNIKVAAGSYRIYLDLNYGEYSLDASMFGKDEPTGEEDKPDEPVAVTGWNIIGLNGNWDTDVLAAQEGNVWTAYITADGDTEFKWRKDGAWDENYGGVMTALGEPFEAVAGGDNIKIGAGFYKVVLDTENLTITVSEGNVWSLIGDFNSWGGDVDMTEADGVWTSPVTKISGGFKIRYNHGWDTNVGGVMTAVGEPFEAVPGGDNISVEEGNYIVTYDTNAGTITVSTAGWGVVGTINDWGNSPDIPMKEEDGYSYLVAHNVTVSASDEIKVRFKNNWDNNFGADTKLGTVVKAYAGGSNIKPGIDGAVDVYFFPDEEVLLVAEAGTDPAYWGVVGTINSWGVPDRILFERDGKLVSNEIELSAADEIKIRQNEAWDVNRGGVFAELGQAFAVENNGANIKVGRDAKVVVVYDPAAETVTLEGEYTGDAPSLPETMYIIGDGVGGWDWGADYIVNMTPVNGKPGQFWAIRNIEAGKGFKFCAVKEWSGDFTGLGEDSGYTVSDGNCFVAENGVYMIYVDTENKKVCVEPAKVYGIGACFGGWNEAMDNALFTAADGKLSITVAASGELRIYAASSIATSDWWTREFIILDGKIAYRGNGGDQERVNVNAGQKVTLDFNAGTGTIE